MNELKNPTFRSPNAKLRFQRKWGRVLRNQINFGRNLVSKNQLDQIKIHLNATGDKMFITRFGTWLTRISSKYKVIRRPVSLPALIWRWLLQPGIRNQFQRKQELMKVELHYHKTLLYLSKIQLNAFYEREWRAIQSERYLSPKTQLYAINEPKWPPVKSGRYSSTAPVNGIFNRSGAVKTDLITNNREMAQNIRALKAVIDSRPQIRITSGIQKSGSQSQYILRRVFLPPKVISAASPLPRLAHDKGLLYFPKTQLYAMNEPKWPPVESGRYSATAPVNGDFNRSGATKTDLITNNREMAQNITALKAVMDSRPQIRINRGIQKSGSQSQCILRRVFLPPKVISAASPLLRLGHDKGLLYLPKTQLYAMNEPKWPPVKSGRYSATAPVNGTFNRAGAAKTDLITGNREMAQNITEPKTTFDSQPQIQVIGGLQKGGSQNQLIEGGDFLHGEAISPASSLVGLVNYKALLSLPKTQPGLMMKQEWPVIESDGNSFLAGSENGVFGRISQLKTLITNHDRNMIRIKTPPKAIANSQPQFQLWEGNRTGKPPLLFTDLPLTVSAPHTAGWEEKNMAPEKKPLNHANTMFPELVIQKTPLPQFPPELIETGGDLSRSIQNGATGDDRPANSVIESNRRKANLEIAKIADQVYQIIEKRLIMEKYRRGIR